MMISKQIALFGIIFLLTACATMSKDECLHADWYIKGLEDATEGYALSRIADHGKACSRVKVIPVMKDYEAGHQKGARLYCVPEKGYSEGRSGNSYNGICPIELSNDFLRAYHDGQELYVIQRNMDNLSNEIANYQSQIQYNYNEIRGLKYDIVNSNNDAKERAKKLRRLDQLQYEITDFEIRSDRAIREIELFKNDFRIVENKHFRMGYIK